MRRILVLAVAALLQAGVAHASTLDFDEKVYSPIVDEDDDGDTEVEFRQGADIGRANNGAAGGVVELERALSRRMSLAVLGLWDRDPHQSARLSELGVESVINLGTIPHLGVDVGTYLEYDQGIRGQGGTGEAKLLLEKQMGGFTSRLNLVAERPFSEHGARTNISYAASMDWRVASHVRLGAESFGEMADGGSWGGRRPYYAGPVVKYEVVGLPHIGIDIEAAWLAALGAARQEANSQFRLIVELEKKF